MILRGGLACPPKNIVEDYTREPIRLIHARLMFIFALIVFLWGTRPYILGHTNRMPCMYGVPEGVTYCIK
jgi:hypothetical protein